MNPKKIRKILSVDFDGTLVDSAFPTILLADLEMIRVLKYAQERGHILILNTCREGIYLDDAVEYLKTHGLIFDYVNEQVPNKCFAGNNTRKIYADYYYDDRSFNWNRDYAIRHINMIATKYGQKQGGKKCTNFIRNIVQKVWKKYMGTK